MNVQLAIDGTPGYRAARRVGTGALGLAPALALALALTLGPVSPAQSQDGNMLGLPARVVKGAGKLMICGGGPMPDDVYREFVRLARGRKSQDRGDSHRQAVHRPPGHGRAFR